MPETVGIVCKEEKNHMWIASTCTTNEVRDDCHMKGDGEEQKLVCKGPDGEQGTKHVWPSVMFPLKLCANLPSEVFPNAEAIKGMIQLL